MKDLKSHKLKFNPYLEKLYQSNKPLIIYKVESGYDIYTDFSKKIILSKNNISKFLSTFEKMKYSKETDQYVGFFGYEILNHLLGVKLKKQIKNKIKHCVTGSLKNSIIEVLKDVKLLRRENNTILLSPAAASFDQFKNFENRGNEFKRLSRMYAKKFI